jgi:hypothetical protein
MNGMKQGIECELMLWKATYDGDTGGRLIFEISKEEIEPFFGLKTRKGGQRFAAVLVLIGDDEKPVPVAAPMPTPVLLNHAGVAELGQTPVMGLESIAPKVRPKFPGGFTGLSVQWCGDVSFIHWIADEFGDEWRQSQKFVRMANKTADAERAGWVIKTVCGVTTRKALDTNPEAHAKFEEKIRERYMEFIKDGRVL